MKKSGKSKEKRKTRKDGMVRLKMSMEKVAIANQVEDFLSPFPAFRSYSRNGITLTLEAKCASNTDTNTLDWIFHLTKTNMQSMYEKCVWGWSDRVKRNEINDSRAIFLLASTTEDRQPVAFSHFRFDMEEDEAVLYCYELQVDREFRGKGLGKFMMQILELLAYRHNMLKVMLTTFKDNGAAKSFFMDKLKYQIDSISPDTSVHGDDPCYWILSKSMVRKSDPSSSDDTSPAPINKSMVRKSDPSSSDDTSPAPIN